MKRKRACRKIRKARRIIKKVVRHHIRRIRQNPKRSWLGALLIGLGCLFIIEIQLGVMNIFLNKAEQTLQANQELIARYLQQLTRSTEDGFNNISSIAVSNHSQTNQLANELKSRTEKVEDMLDVSEERLKAHSLELEQLKNSVNKDRTKMLKEVLLPSVRVKMPDGVGGGTIIYSRPDRKGNYQTYVLTAYHVIHRLIRRDTKGCEIRDEVTVEVWREDMSRLDKYRAKIVTYHPNKDLALLRLKTGLPFKHTARLIPKADIDKLMVFTRVYTVGCPLGYDPVPTYGEITQTKRKVNGEKVWLMNAPTIFGNSGGGVFLAETNRLIALSSRIAAYGNLISIPVTHLGMIIPPDVIHEWLDSQLFQFLYNDNVSKEQCDLLRTGLTGFIPMLQSVREE